MLKLIGEANVLLKPKRSMLPVLTVLFLISYGLMAMLVVEQARTIDSQRSLIRALFSDSTELTAMKGKAVQKQRADAQAEGEAGAQSQAQTPSSQAPSPERGKSDRKAGKSRRRAPQKPSKPASDRADERRMPISI